MFGLVLTAVSLGLSNFAAAIGIGLSGVDSNLRLRVALVFGAFEAVMPLVGLVIGDHLAELLGASSRYFGGFLLIATGFYATMQASRSSAGESDHKRSLGQLIVTGAALSIDNLVVGFALGATRVSLVVAVPLIAIVSISLSLLGLELGDRLGSVVERRSGEVGGVVLILVGVAVVAGLF
jgi:putative Mn2+ efflux pump MntP